MSSAGYECPTGLFERQLTTTTITHFLSRAGRQQPSLKACLLEEVVAEGRHELGRGGVPHGLVAEGLKGLLERLVEEAVVAEALRHVLRTGSTSVRVLALSATHRLHSRQAGLGSCTGAQGSSVSCS